MSGASQFSGGRAGAAALATVLLLACPALFKLPAACAEKQAGPLTKTLVLQAASLPRQLPDRFSGAQVEPFLERLIDSPEKVDICRQMRLAYLRFPGGVAANYYHWKTGLFSITAYSNSSESTRFWAQLSAGVARNRPQGVSFDQFRKFADAVGAAVVLVPNLETATVDEDVAWFKQMKKDGLLPNRIEMGSDFFQSMGRDPNVIGRWKDEPAAIGIMKQYADVLRPQFTPGTKIAVQSAASAFTPRPFFKKSLLDWDSRLRAEPWFDAVTLHLYPRIEETVDRSLMNPGNGEALFRAMMARVDTGTELALQDMERRLPGKEIWVSEWNTRGVDLTHADSPVTFAMQTLLTARMCLTFLRHPAVTMSLFSTLAFEPDINGGIYYRDVQGRILPTGPAIVLSWINDAVNGGALHQRFIEEDAPRLAGGGLFQEGYLAVEGTLLRKKGRAVFLLENASAEEKRFFPFVLGTRRPPDRVEQISVPRLANYSKTAPSVQTVTNTTSGISIPPYSFSRVIWNSWQ